MSSNEPELSISYVQIDYIVKYSFSEFFWDSFFSFNEYKFEYDS